MRRLIGVAGKTASGKTLVAEALVKHFDAPTNRVSKVLAAFAEQLNLPTDKATLQRVSTALRSTYGEDTLSRGIAEWVKQQNTETVVVEGIRRITDIDTLEKAAQESGREWLLIFVDAPEDIRFERYNARLARDGEESITQDAFKTLEGQECEEELPLIISRAHITLTNNEKTPEDLIQEALTFVEK